MKLLKVLDKNLMSPHQKFKYEIGKKYICDDFDTNIEKSCSRGFYAMDIDGIPCSWGGEEKHIIVEVEVGGRSVEIDKYKRRFEEQTILRILEKEEIISLAKSKEKELEYKLSEVLFPVNPLLLKKKKLTEKHIELLKKWASVIDSVWLSVVNSIRDSKVDPMPDTLVDSVLYLLWDIMWDSMKASHIYSVKASIGAYISSLFPMVKKWKYFEHVNDPFRSAIDLWNDGFIPVSNDRIWMLCQRKNAKIVYKLKNDL